MSRRFHVGPAEKFGPGMIAQVTLPPDPDRGVPRWAIVLRDRHGALRAYLNLCKHLPVPLDGGSGNFVAPDGVHLICGTHGALYRPEDGVCVQGPCEGARLDALEVQLEDGEVFIVDPGPASLVMPS